jgi:hypothetical protein
VLLPNLKVLAGVVHALGDGGGLQLATAVAVVGVVAVGAGVLDVGQVHRGLGLPHVVEGVRVVHRQSLQSSHSHGRLRNSGGEGAATGAVAYDRHTSVVRAEARRQEVVVSLQL